MKKILILLIFQSVFSQKENIFSDFKPTDSLYSFHIYDYEKKPEKSYFLKHSKIKDTLINGIFFSKFSLNDYMNEYSYWIGLKDKTYYFFKGNDNMIDSVSILNKNKKVLIHPFNEFYTIKVRQIIDKSYNNKLILDFKRKRKKMFDSFYVFRIIIDSNEGPFLFFKNKKYDLQSHNSISYDK